MARKALSKKIRFEVFKRDGFTCQYCGASAPDVVLHVDHIHPVSKGGTNEVINLITACSGCNGGKSATQLDDKTVVKKQIDQLKDLNERSEQIKMMAQWRVGMASIEDEQVAVINSEIGRQSNCALTDKGKREIKSAIKKYGLLEVLEATQKSFAQYFIKGDQAAMEKTISYIPRICYWQQKTKEDPRTSDLLRVCAIAQKNWWKCNRSEVFRLAKHYSDAGVPADHILEVARIVSGVMKFQEALDSAIEVIRG